MMTLTINSGAILLEVFLVRLVLVRLAGKETHEICLLLWKNRKYVIQLKSTKATENKTEVKWGAVSVKLESRSAFEPP